MEGDGAGARRGAVAAFAAAAGLAALFHLHARFLNDDSLITIRYADHLASGQGLVYNAGERVLGTTAPLWALLLSLCGALGLPLVATAHWLGILAFGAAGWATLRLFRARGAPPLGQALAVALVATSPVLLRWAGSGMETALAVALLATFLWLYEEGRLRALGVVGGALVLTRPDAGLFLAAAALLDTHRKRSLRPLLRPLPGFLAVVLPWVAWATWYYGSPLPNSGFAKSLQEADWGPYAVRLAGEAWRVGPLLPFAALGFARAVGDQPRALPALSLAVLVGAMHLAGFPGCGWYMAFPMYLVCVLAADGATLVAERLAGAGGPGPAARLLPLAVLGGALLAHVPVLEEVRAAKRDQASLERLHGAVGAWLAERAPRGVSVGVDNIGYIGWRSGLRVVDMLGLVQADVRDAIAEQHARGERMDWALRHHRPELVAMWVGRGNTWKYRPDLDWFEREGYRRVFRVRADERAEEPAYTVFSRVPIPGVEPQ